NQTNWDETVVRSVVLTSPSRRSGRSDPRLSGSPAFFPLRWPSVSLPSEPAAESNCPTTSDSKACKDYLSDLFQTPQSGVKEMLCLTRRRPELDRAVCKGSAAGEAEAGSAGTQPR